MQATVDCPERVDLDTDIWPVEVPFDHCPQVSHPAEIGDLLAAIARDATS